MRRSRRGSVAQVSDHGWSLSSSAPGHRRDEFGQEVRRGGAQHSYRSGAAARRRPATAPGPPPAVAARGRRGARRRPPRRRRPAATCRRARTGRPPPAAGAPARTLRRASADRTTRGRASLARPPRSGARDGRAVAATCSWRPRPRRPRVRGVRRVPGPAAASWRMRWPAATSPGVCAAGPPVATDVGASASRSLPCPPWTATPLRSSPALTPHTSVGRRGRGVGSGARDTGGAKSFSRRAYQTLRPAAPVARMGVVAGRPVEKTVYCGGPMPYASRRQKRRMG